eukprot:UN27715
MNVKGEAFALVARSGQQMLESFTLFNNGRKIASLKAFAYFLRF